MSYSIRKLKIYLYHHGKCWRNYENYVKHIQPPDRRVVPLSTIKFFLAFRLL